MTLLQCEWASIRRWSLSLFVAQLQKAPKKQNVLEKAAIKCDRTCVIFVMHKCGLRRFSHQKCIIFMELVILMETNTKPHQNVYTLNYVRNHKPNI